MNVNSAGRTWITILATLALTASGCSQAPTSSSTSQSGAAEMPALTELTGLADPTSYGGPSTAIVASRSIPPLEEAPSSTLPVTVTSKDPTGDTEVTVNDTSRIVALSLSGSVGDMIYAYGLGEAIVGRDISTSFPGAEDIPVVTKDGHSVDAESVLSLDPSVIITDGSVGPTDVVLQMRDAGIPVVTVQRAVDPETSAVAATQIAKALGITEAAPAFIDTMNQAIADKEAEVRQLLPEDPANTPRVAFLYVRGTAGIFYLFGEGSGIDSLLESVGAIDVAKEIGWVGEKPMTEEALVAMDPDIIIVMTKGLTSVGGVDGLLAAQPSIALTTAGKNRRIIDIEDTVVLAGGTRIPDVIDGLARAIYAPDSLKTS